MSGRYGAGRQAFAQGDLSWTDDRIVAQLLTNEYVFSEWHRQVGAVYGRIGKPVSVAGRYVDRGAYGSSSIRFPQVGAGETAAAMLIYREDGLLISYHDNIDGFPMRTNGGDLHVDLPKEGFWWAPKNAGPMGRYDSARDAFGRGELSWTRDSIVAQLVSDEYTFDPNHETGADLKGMIGGVVPITSPHVTNGGWVRSDGLAFPPTASRPHAVVIARRRGSEPAMLISCHLGEFPIAAEQFVMTAPEGGWFRQ